MTYGFEKTFSICWILNTDTIMNANTDKYERAGNTEVLTNTIPTETIEGAYMWIGDRHTFEINKSDIEDGFFTLSISLQVICLISLPSAISLIHNSSDRQNKKIKDTYPTLTTRETFRLNESEKDNYELAHELIVESINRFNLIFAETSLSFSSGREYKVPTYEECFPKVIYAYSRR